MKKKLTGVYKRLYAKFGPQYWWPGETPFEVMVGAVLTQSTSWLNVEKAIANLKKNKLLNARKLHNLSHQKRAQLIRSAGYYNIKARRLKEFLSFLIKKHDVNLKKMSRLDLAKLRQELLKVKGIGQETADSILLYALNKPIFVVDSYTKRIFSRHGFISEKAVYEEVQKLFMDNLKHEVKLFNEYHALIVKLAKDFCVKSKPKCDLCPLEGVHA